MRSHNGSDVMGKTREPAGQAVGFGSVIRLCFTVGCLLSSFPSILFLLLTAGLGFANVTDPF